MTVLNIIKYPNETLRQATQIISAFDKELHKLLDDMADTMYSANGVGLAAPQVGILKRVAVIDVSEERNNLIELINPKLVLNGKQITSEEGCLSIPGFRDSIKRSEFAEIHALDRFGKEFVIQAEELLAICAQHEVDHLDGILFIDHLSKLKLKFFKAWLQKRSPLE